MYYIFYEYYTEYNQFEGSWDWRVEKMRSYNKIKELQKSLKKSSDYRSVSQILEKAMDPEYLQSGQI